jgi:hypothetical protein
MPEPEKPEIAFSDGFQALSDAARSIRPRR